MTEILRANWGPRFLLLTTFFTAIILYGLFRSENLFIGPELSVTKPASGTVVHDAFVTVTGRAERIAEITLEGRKIFIDREGRFTESLLLARGYNSITIEAADRFGRRTTKTLQLVLN